MRRITVQFGGFTKFRVEHTKNPSRLFRTVLALFFVLLIPVSVFANITYPATVDAGSRKRRPSDTTISTPTSVSEPYNSGENFWVTGKHTLKSANDVSPLVYLTNPVKQCTSFSGNEDFSCTYRAEPGHYVKSIYGNVGAIYIVNAINIATSEGQGCPDEQYWWWLYNHDSDEEGASRLYVYSWSAGGWKADYSSNYDAKFDIDNFPYFFYEEEPILKCSVISIEAIPSDTSAVWFVVPPNIEDSYEVWVKLKDTEEIVKVFGPQQLFGGDSGTRYSVYLTAFTKQCDLGEYQPGTEKAGSSARVAVNLACESCPDGGTTASQGATSITDCIKNSSGSDPTGQYTDTCHYEK